MKISIITVTYNAVGVLEKTLQSIFEQTVRDFECLIIDGGSKDGTLDIIKRYENIASQQDMAFRYISEKDNGLYDAMNKGLTLAQGDFVWFINAGDKIYDNDTVALILQQLAESSGNTADAGMYGKEGEYGKAGGHTPDGIYGQSLIIDENDRPLGERHKIAPSHLTKKSLLNGLVVCHQSILVSREIAPQYNTGYRISADYDWTIRVLEKSRGNLYINSYLSRFMIAGISAKHRKKSLRERYRIMRRHFGVINTVTAHLCILLKYPFTKKY
jgi:glycosyltransferase involved in cell wall biosynthesis